MPISKSSKRALRTSGYKKAQNDKTKTSLEIAIKKTTEKTISATISKIDKVAKIGIFHKNKAAHLKSQLMARFSNPKTLSSNKKKTETKTTAKKAGKTPVKKVTVKRTRSSR